MKTIYISLVLFFAAVFTAAADIYPPEGWTDNLLEALAESEKTGKNILLDFTGSDWCVWCHRLTDEVFSQQEFKDYAEENLVLVYLDFPRNIELPEETVMQNQLMMQLFGVQGFPTIWMMDSEQVPLLQVGYQEGGAANYVEILKNSRVELTDEQKEQNQLIIRSAIEQYLGSW
ncbi:MAG: thioredoxin family protein [Spirochaetales bacterium]|nr:thioredoxin family protein [Spirochaetales bacterium]